MTEENVEIQNEQEEISIEGLTINGVPAESLSAIGQSTLKKIILKKREMNELAKQVDDLSKRYNETQSVLNTLAELLKEETNSTPSE